MTCGCPSLRLNGVWVSLHGVQSNLQRQIERPGSSFTTVGGVRHAQTAPRPIRSWGLDFGQSGPEAVAALAVAAQNPSGEVWLWDESAARANMLDPLPLADRPGYPLIDCGGMPLLSLTSGAEAATTTRDVPLKANLTIRSTGESAAYDWLALDPGTVDALLKVSVPPTPTGMQLESAELILFPDEVLSGSTVTARRASNAWTEEGGVDYWTSVPGGTVLGTAAVGVPSTSVPLGDITAFVGTDMSVRLSASGMFAIVEGRNLAHPPILRITYNVLAKDRTFTQQLRAGTYYLGCWSDAAAGTEFGQMVVDLGSGPITAPLLATAGSGWRYMSAPVTLPNPVTVECTIWDSADYLLGGFMLSTVDHPGVYLPGEKTPVRVKVNDPTLVLAELYGGLQGQGERTVTLEEVGA